MDKRDRVHALQKYLVNPTVRTLIKLGLGPNDVALLETVGRKTGKPRTTPVGNGLDRDGRTFWIVSEHGRRSSYVRNIEANPRVRVKTGRTWRSGTAHVLPDDDPLERQKTLPQRNAANVRRFGTDLLTVRVDLDE